MVKKIGSFLILFFSAIALNASPSITIRLTDNNGSRITTAAVGVPFKLHIAINDGKSVEKLSIEGLDAFNKGNVSKQTNYRMINGVSSNEIVYIYPLRADTEGNYTIGPVHAQIDGVSISSNTLSVKVEARTSSAEMDDRTHAFVELMVDRNVVVVGEPVQLTIKFFHDEQTKLAEPLAMNLEGWTMREQEQLPEKVVSVQGADYFMQEFQCTIVRNDAGSFMLPPVIASCMIVTSQRDDHDIFPFADFFGRRREKPFQTYSNTVRVVVENLAAQNAEVSSVGALQSAQLTFDTRTAKQGEGMVARLSIEGEGDAQGLKAPALQLPESFTSYDSKSEIHKIPGTKKWQKIFEYIVQGTKPGVFEVAAQEIMFFDIHSRSFRTLKTKPIQLEIIAVKQLMQVPAQPTASQESDLSNSLPEEAKQLVIPSESASADMVWWLMIVIGIAASLLLFYGFILKIWPIIRHAMHRTSQVSGQSNAFKALKSQLLVHKKRGDASSIYALFITAFAQRCVVEPGQVTEEFIEQLLQSKHVPQERIQRWKTDFELFAERAFFSRNSHHDEQLFDIALQWADYFVITMRL